MSPRALMSLMFLYLLLLTALVFLAAPASRAAEPVPNTTPGLYVSNVIPVSGLVPGSESAKIVVILSNGKVDVLSPCRYEDGRHCYWAASARGNRQGRSFIVTRGRIFYLNLAGIPTTSTRG